MIPILKKYIDKSTANAHNSVYHIYGGDISIFIKDQPSNNINIANVAFDLENKIPIEFIRNVDAIYVGDFAFFDQKNITSSYHENTIYVSNNQQSDKEMLSDILHEVGHSVEEAFYNHIYSDGILEGEFVKKREQLYYLLRSHNLPTIDREYFQNTDYTEVFDIYLYEEIGYEKLNMISSNIFVSPYAATSLREYFANSFEEYYGGNYLLVKKINPVVFNMLEDLIYVEVK